MTPSQRIDTALFALAVAVWSPLGHAAPPFERVLEKPCRALALDREPYVAALGDDSITVMDKRGTHEEALPLALRGSSVDVGLFFGRDYRVRVAGTAHTPSGDEVRYYRSLPDGLRPALDELGPLGGRGGPGLLALLGTADPEIVCRPGQSCLIKSINGWAKASAPPGLERVGLSLGSGWAIAGQTFFVLKKDWQPLPAPGPWKKAEARWCGGTGRAWSSGHRASFTISTGRGGTAHPRRWQARAPCGQARSPSGWLGTEAPPRVRATPSPPSAPFDRSLRCSAARPKTCGCARTAACTGHGR